MAALRKGAKADSEELFNSFAAFFASLREIHP
jgi:hypothetical protein